VCGREGAEAYFRRLVADRSPTETDGRLCWHSGGLVGCLPGRDSGVDGDYLLTQRKNGGPQRATEVQGGIAPSGADLPSCQVDVWIRPCGYVWRGVFQQCRSRRAQRHSLFSVALCFSSVFTCLDDLAARPPPVTPSQPKRRHRLSMPMDLAPARCAAASTGNQRQPRPCCRHRAGNPYPATTTAPHWRDGPSLHAICCGRQAKRSHPSPPSGR
jgi:hypothetical protein